MQQNIPSKTWILHRGMYSVYNHFLETDRNIDHIHDPFYYVTCITCGACEGIPVEQNKRDLGGFPNVEEKDAPEGTLFECYVCSKNQKHHVLQIDIDSQEGEPLTI
jgi:hypothetical protein